MCEQKCLCKSFGIQVGDCKTPVEPKTKGGHFEKLDLFRPTNCPGCSPEAAAFPCAFGTSLTCLQSCHRLLLSRYLGGATSLLVPGSRPADPWTQLQGHELSPAPLSLLFPWQSCPPKDLVETMSLGTTSNRPINFRSDCNPWGCLVTWLQSCCTEVWKVSFQPHLPFHPSSPATQWEHAQGGGGSHTWLQPW